MRIREREASAAEWNQFYERGDSPWRSQGLCRITRRFLRCYSSGSKLLEIGCGLGDDASAIANMGFDYTGIDISEVAIRSAQAKITGENFRFEWSDLFRYSNAKGFDIIYDKGLFHGLGGARRRTTFLRRVASLLQPMGVWITVCGSADHHQREFSHGAVYLRDLVGPAEVYFEVLAVIKDYYGLADQKHDFCAWHGAFRKR